MRLLLLSIVILLRFSSAGCMAQTRCPAPPPPAPPPPPLLVSALPVPNAAHQALVPFTVVRRKNYRIEYGEYGLEVDPTEGGRIVEFSLAGQSIIVPVTESPEAFGSSLWTSPQSDWNWPPPPELDRLPWRVIDEPLALVLQSETSEKLGLSVRQRLTAEPSKGSLLLEYEFTNRSAVPRRMAPWQNTRVRPKGLTFYPASRASYAIKNNTLVLAPEDNIAWFKHEPDKIKGNLKSLADGEEGWMAQLDDRLLFIKIFDDVPVAVQAPGEGELVIYVAGNGQFVEMENQGAYQELLPGAEFIWKLRWVLRRLPDNIASTKGNRALVDFARKTVREVRDQK
jgi:hypothetical protein